MTSLITSKEGGSPKPPPVAKPSSAVSVSVECICTNLRHEGHHGESPPLEAAEPSQILPNQASVLRNFLVEVGGGDGFGFTAGTQPTEPHQLETHSQVWWWGEAMIISLTITHNLWTNCGDGFHRRFALVGKSTFQLWVLY